jgi:hypothetical protein
MLRTVTCLLALLIIGLSGGRQPIRTSRSVVPAGCATRLRSGRAHGGESRPPAWIISAQGLSRLLAAGLPRALLRRDFNQPSTLLLVNQGKRDPIAPLASLTYVFESATALSAALARHQVPAGVNYLLLDLERWPLTPRAQQFDPIASLKDAAATAHTHFKCVIFTPALDLMSGLAPPLPEPALYKHFDSQIVRPGAASSDIFEVQAQHTEGTKFVTEFAPGAVTAAHSAHPGEPVLVGLSTNPNGRHVTAADLLSLYRAARRAGAAGFWLNIAGRSLECPRCGTPQTAVAVNFLRTVSTATAIR